MDITKSILKNYILNLLYQVLIVILPLITAPYLARVLGAARIGEYSFAQSIVSYFALFAVMGTAMYGQRYIASCHAKGRSILQPFVELVILRCIGVGVALLVYFSLVFRGVSNQLLYLVAAIEILAVVFDISWFYQGIEQFQNITVCNSVSKLLGIVCIFLFVKTQADLELYVVFYCCSLLLGNVAQWISFPTYVKGHSLQKPALLQHLKPTFGLFISQFAIQAYTVLDRTMIGLITKSDYENGYYDQAQKLIKALTAVITSIGAVMASRIAIIWHSNATDKDEQIQKLLLFSFRLVFALSLPITIGTMVIASRFVPIFFGEGYDPVVGLIQAQSVILPLIGCSNIIGIQLLVPSGRENLLTKSVVIGAAVNICLNAFFIAKIGALGAVIASILAELTVTCVQLYFARKEIPLGKVLSLFLRYLLLSVLIGVIGNVTAMFVGTGFGGLSAIVLVCVIAYAMILFLLKDPILKFNP